LPLHPFKCSFEHVKSTFYCVLNTLLYRVHGASELVSVQLVKSFCVPVISYALEAVSLNVFYYIRWTISLIEPCSEYLSVWNMVH